MENYMGALVLLYSIIVYLAFFAAFLYLIAFVGGDMIPFIEMPKTIDSGGSNLANLPPALVNIGLLLLFGVQHSIMARQGFKRALTKLIPWPAERTTFVLVTVVVLVLLYVYWVPMPASVWSVASPLWSGVLSGLFFLGFGLVLVSTFLIDHFELFGLMQGWFRFKGKTAPKPEFRTPSLYRYVRHPLYLGFLLAFWATPNMSVGHLLFAAVWTAYIFVAIGYEERDLTALFGERYREYMAKTPMILPFGGRK
jgi:protein-S-isoprenylcysteine O-methyltransferase Ste14